MAQIVHLSCKGETTLDDDTAAELHADPTAYDALPCDKHNDFFLVKEFHWKDTGLSVVRLG